MGINSFFAEAAGGHLQDIKDLLERQATAFEKQIERSNIVAEAEEYRWLRNQGIADATGQIQLPLENRVGFDLELVSFSAVGGAASNGALLFYQNSVEPQNLYWSTPQTQYNSDKFVRGMIVPQNTILVAQFLNMGNAQLLFVNVFARRAQVARNQPYHPSPQGW